MSLELALRAVDASDELHESFFAASRTDFDLLPEPVRSTMIAQQSRMQMAAYASSYPDMRIEVADVDDTPIVRLMTAELADHVLVIDIVVRPEARGSGIARHALGVVVARADAQRLETRASIRSDNTASRRLHEGLGFECVADDGDYSAYVRPTSAEAG